MQTKNNKDKKFWISRENFDRIIAYAESAYRLHQSEIGGQLVVLEDKDGDFILEDPVILKQEISAANCELDGEQLAIHYSKMIGKHGNNVRHCWWHSHHTMGAFWSGTDDSTILSHPANDWTLSLVVNLKREYKLRIQFFNPFMHEENVELNMMTDPDVVNPKIDKEVNDLCSKETTSVVTYGGTGSQASLWNQNREVRSYNQSFQQTNWWDDIDDELNVTGIPVGTLEKCIEEMDEMIDGFMDGTVKGKSFRKRTRKLDKLLKQYNLKVKTMKTVTDIHDECMTNSPIDMFENIEGVENGRI
jgi:hypothetical protein